MRRLEGIPAAATQRPRARTCNRAPATSVTDGAPLGVLAAAAAAASAGMLAAADVAVTFGFPTMPEATCLPAALVPAARASAEPPIPVSTSRRDRARPAETCCTACSKPVALQLGGFHRCTTCNLVVHATQSECMQAGALLTDFIAGEIRSSTSRDRSYRVQFCGSACQQSWKKTLTTSQQTSEPVPEHCQEQAQASPSDEAVSPPHVPASVSLSDSSVGAREAASTGRVLRERTPVDYAKRIVIKGGNLVYAAGASIKVGLKYQIQVDRLPDPYAPALRDDGAAVYTDQELLKTFNSNNSDLFLVSAVVSKIDHIVSSEPFNTITKLSVRELLRRSVLATCSPQIGDFVATFGDALEHPVVESHIDNAISRRLRLENLDEEQRSRFGLASKRRQKQLVGPSGWAPLSAADLCLLEYFRKAGPVLRMSVVYDSPLSGLMDFEDLRPLLTGDELGNKLMDVLIQQLLRSIHPESIFLPMQLIKRLDFPLRYLPATPQSFLNKFLRTLPSKHYRSLFLGVPLPGHWALVEAVLQPDHPNKPCICDFYDSLPSSRNTEKLNRITSKMRTLQFGSLQLPAGLQSSEAARDTVPNRSRSTVQRPHQGSTLHCGVYTIMTADTRAQGSKDLSHVCNRFMPYFRSLLALQLLSLPHARRSIRVAQVSAASVLGMPLYFLNAALSLGAHFHDPPMQRADCLASCVRFALWENEHGDNKGIVELDKDVEDVGLSLGWIHQTLQQHKRQATLVLFDRPGPRLQQQPPLNTSCSDSHGLRPFIYKVGDSNGLILPCTFVCEVDAQHCSLFSWRNHMSTHATFWTTVLSPLSASSPSQWPWLYENLAHALVRAFGYTGGAEVCLL